MSFSSCDQQASYREIQVIYNLNVSFYNTKGALGHIQDWQYDSYISPGLCEQGTIILGSLPAEVMKLSSLEDSYQEKKAPSYEPSKDGRGRNLTCHTAPHFATSPNQRMFACLSTKTLPNATLSCLQRRLSMINRATYRSRNHSASLTGKPVRQTTSCYLNL